MNKFTISLIALLLCSACSEEEITSRNYPRVDTEDVTDITTTGMIFHGKIFFSSVEILDYGFIWTDTGFPTVTNGNKISLGPRNDVGLFEIAAVESLQSGKMYSVRAYAQSANFIVYGRIVEFERP
jgi:hypothetical protein